MATTMSISRTRELPSVKVQALATLAAIIGAVAIPQIFHVVGAICGMGTGLSEAFLPMHLPIILVGLLAGPYAGAIAGAFGPLVSFALSGMPGLAMLPFMVIELAAYGLIAGLLRTANMPTIAKVLLVQVGGRVVRAAAILFAVGVLGNTTVAVATIWMSVLAGLPGLILQWGLIPLIMFWVEHRAAKERRLSIRSDD